MRTVVWWVVVIAAVFFLAGLAVPETRFAILEGIGNAWDALVSDARNSGI